MGDSIIQGFLDSLKPVPLVSVSKWADDNRWLSSQSSAEPGRWRTSRVPYLREIMDNMSPNSPINDQIVVKGVQLGFTEGGLNTVGCFMDISPCPIMYVMPTIQMAKDISKDRVSPMIELSPTLSKKVKPNKSKDPDNSILVKKIPGGMLVLSGANSAASLRSRPVKILVLDEVDGYPQDVDGEGSPVSLAEKRTSTFGAKRKIYKLSTPTIDGVSVIQKEFEQTEQRRFYVACPHCSATQTLKFEQLKWEDGNPDSVMYQCEHCDEKIEERFKTTMLESGFWQADVPDLQTALRRGYHINSLYSPLGWLSWADIIRQYGKALEDENEMKVFVNTILGETYKIKGDAPEWEHIYNRREHYPVDSIPDGVYFLTAGVDIQKDRIEMEIVGWGKDRKSYSIDYQVLLGRTTEQPVWELLAKFLNKSWKHPSGVDISISIMAVDSGYNTSEVYDFVKKNGIYRVIPTKGNDKLSVIVSNPRAVHTQRNGKKINNEMKVWHVGVNVIKDELYGFLNTQKAEDGTKPAGYCSFPQYDEHYFKMLTAEKKSIVKDKRGFSVYTWTLPSGKRNEALDCRVYARAAASVYGIDRFTEEDFNSLITPPTPVENKVKKKSSFWDKNSRYD